jgi:hypothetical protein
VIAVGACGRIGFDAIGDGSVPNGDGRGGDSSMGSGFSGSGCLSPGIGDSFDEIMPCKAWGEPVVDNSSLNVSNGQLTITPQANASSAGGCLLGSMPFTDAGFFVQIGQFPSAGQLQLEIDDVSNDISWAIAENDLLVIELIKTGDSMPATIPFDTSLTWWRLRPTGTSVVYETSADGETWTVQRTAPGAAPTTVAATIEDIVDDPVPGTAIIDGIDICP